MKPMVLVVQRTLAVDTDAMEIRGTIRKRDLSARFMMATASSTVNSNSASKKVTKLSASKRTGKLLGGGVTLAINLSLAQVVRPNLLISIGIVSSPSDCIQLAATVVANIKQSAQLNRQLQ